MKKWRLLGIVLVTFIVGVVGCGETQQMMKPVVDEITEPKDTTPPPTTVGGMKQDEKPEADNRTEPEEPDEVAEESEKPTEPEVLADTIAPTVVAVEYYSDRKMEQELTATSMVRPEDTVYVKVVFSEPVKHVATDDANARPALSIVIDDEPMRLNVLAKDAAEEEFVSNTCKPLQDTDAYLCQYTLPEEASTIGLQIEGDTADTAGNTINEVSVHTAPFAVESEQPRIVLPPGYTLPPELIPTEETVLSAVEQSLIEAQEKIGWDATAVRASTTDSPADMISLLPYKDREEVYELFVSSVDLPRFEEAAQKMKEINIELAILGGEWKETGNSEAYFTFLEKAERERGLHRVSSAILEEIYFEERPEDLPHENGNSRYWMILEWYRLQLAHPEVDINLRLFDLLDIYRESCRKGNIFGLNNPWS